MVTFHALITFLICMAITPRSDCFCSTSSRPLSILSLPSLTEYAPKLNKNISLRTYPSRRPSLKIASTHDKIQPSASSIASNLKTFASAGSLILLDALLRQSFKAMSIQFPSSLAGCTALFTFMLLLHSLNNDWGDYVHSLFNPGATLFAKWLPVFFVPSLVTLPLAPSLGSTHEVRYSYVYLFLLKSLIST
jgi:putative effector of murein hydrolase LrgA (UPF0299 family)